MIEPEESSRQESQLSVEPEPELEITTEVFPCDDIQKKITEDMSENDVDGKIVRKHTTTIEHFQPVTEVKRRGDLEVERNETEQYLGKEIKEDVTEFPSGCEDYEDRQYGVTKSTSVKSSEQTLEDGTWQKNTTTTLVITVDESEPTTEIIPVDDIVQQRVDEEDNEQELDDGTVVKTHTTTTTHYRNAYKVTKQGNVELDRQEIEEHIGTEIYEDVLETPAGVTDLEDIQRSVSKKVAVRDESGTKEDGTWFTKKTTTTTVTLLSEEEVNDLVAEGIEPEQSHIIEQSPPSDEVTTDVIPVDDEIKQRTTEEDKEEIQNDIIIKTHTTTTTHFKDAIEVKRAGDVELERNDCEQLIGTEVEIRITEVPEGVDVEDNSQSYSRKTSEQQSEKTEADGTWYKQNVITTTITVLSDEHLIAASESPAAQEGIVKEVQETQPDGTVITKRIVVKRIGDSFVRYVYIVHPDGSVVLDMQTQHGINETVPSELFKENNILKPLSLSDDNDGFNIDYVRQSPNNIISKVPDEVISQAMQDAQSSITPQPKSASVDAPSELLVKHPVAIEEVQFSESMPVYATNADKSPLSVKPQNIDMIITEKTDDISVPNRSEITHTVADLLSTFVPLTEEIVISEVVQESEKQLPDGKFLKTRTITRQTSFGTVIETISLSEDGEVTRNIERTKITATAKIPPTEMNVLTSIEHVEVDAVATDAPIDESVTTPSIVPDSLPLELIEPKMTQSTEKSPCIEKPTPVIESTDVPLDVKIETEVLDEQLSFSSPPQHATTGKTPQLIPSETLPDSQELLDELTSDEKGTAKYSVTALTSTFVPLTEEVVLSEMVAEDEVLLDGKKLKRRTITRQTSFGTVIETISETPEGGIKREMIRSTAQVTPSEMNLTTPTEQIEIHALTTEAPSDDIIATSTLVPETLPTDLDEIQQVSQSLQSPSIEKPVPTHEAIDVPLEIAVEPEILDTSDLPQSVAPLQISSDKTPHTVPPTIIEENSGENLDYFTTPEELEATASLARLTSSFVPLTEEVVLSESFTTSKETLADGRVLRRKVITRQTSFGTVIETISETEDGDVKRETIRSAPRVAPPEMGVTTPIEHVDVHANTTESPSDEILQTPSIVPDSLPLELNTDCSIKTDTGPAIQKPTPVVEVAAMPVDVTIQPETISAAELPESSSPSIASDKLPQMVPPSTLDESGKECVDDISNLQSTELTPILIELTSTFVPLQEEIVINELVEQSQKELPDGKFLRTKVITRQTSFGTVVETITETSDGDVKREIIRSTAQVAPSAMNVVTPFEQIEVMPTQRENDMRVIAEISVDDVSDSTALQAGNNQPNQKCVPPLPIDDSTSHSPIHTDEEFERLPDSTGYLESVKPVHDPEPSSSSRFLPHDSSPELHDPPSFTHSIDVSETSGLFPGTVVPNTDELNKRDHNINDDIAKPQFQIDSQIYKSSTHDNTVTNEVMPNKDVQIIKDVTFTEEILGNNPIKEHCDPNLVCVDSIDTSTGYRVNEEIDGKSSSTPASITTNQDHNSTDKQSLLLSTEEEDTQYPVSSFSDKEDECVENMQSAVKRTPHGMDDNTKECTEIFPDVSIAKHQQLDISDENDREEDKTLAGETISNHNKTATPATHASRTSEFDDENTNTDVAECEQISDGTIIKHNKFTANVQRSASHEDSNFTDITPKDDQRDDKYDSEEGEETLSDGTIIQHKRITTQIHTSMKLRDEPNTYVEEFGETFSDGNHDNSNLSDVNLNDNLHDDKGDVEEWEETLSDGTIIKRKKITTQIHTSTVSSIEDHDEEETNPDIEEWEETLSDGTIIKRKKITTNVIKTAASLDDPNLKDLSSKGDQHDDNDDIDDAEEWEQTLSDGTIINRKSITTQVHTSTVSSIDDYDDDERNPDVEEWDETLSDGTIIKRKRLPTNVITTTASLDDPNLKYLSSKGDQHDDNDDCEELEETLSDGTIIKRKRITTQVHTSTVSSIDDHDDDDDERNPDVKEWEETLSDGTIIKRKRLITNVVTTTASLDDPNLNDLSSKGDQHDDNDSEEWEETLSDGTIIKRKRITTHVHTSTVSNIDDHDDDERNPDVEEWEETLSDGTIIKRKRLTTNVITTTASLDDPNLKDLSSKGDQHDDSDDSEEWKKTLSDGPIIKRKRITTRAHTSTVSNVDDHDDDERNSDVEEWEETLSDGTIIKRKRLTTNVITTTSCLDDPNLKDLSSKGDQHDDNDDNDDSEEWKETLSDGTIIKRKRITTRVHTSTVSNIDDHDDDEGNPDVEEWEETLSDGTIIKRTRLTTNVITTTASLDNPNMKDLSSKGDQHDDIDDSEECEETLSDGTIIKRKRITTQVHTSTVSNIDDDDDDNEINPDVEEWEETLSDGTMIKRKRLTTNVITTTASLDNLNMKDLSSKGDQHDDNDDSEECEETLSDGTIIKRKRITTQVHTSTVSNIDDHDDHDDERNPDVEEWEETLSDGTIIKRKRLTTKVITTASLDNTNMKDLSSKGDQHDDNDHSEEWEETLSDGTIIKRKRIMTQVHTSTVSNIDDDDGDNEINPDVEEWEETLSDGTMIKRKRLTTNVITITASLDNPNMKDLSSKGDQHDNNDDSEEWEETLFDGTIIKRKRITTQLQTSTSHDAPITHVAEPGKRFSDGSQDNSNLSDRKFKDILHDDEADVEEWEETLSDGTIIKRKRITTQVHTSTVSNIDDHDDDDERNPDIEEWEETLSDGTIIKRKRLSANVITTATSLDDPNLEDLSPKGDQHDDNDDSEEWEETLSDGTIIRRKRLITTLNRGTFGLNQTTTSKEIDDELNSDTEEWEETLSDGTIIKRRKVIKTVHTSIMSSADRDSTTILNPQIHESLLQLPDSIHDLALDETNDNIEEWNESLADGTIIQRKRITQTHYGNRSNIPLTLQEIITEQPAENIEECEEMQSDGTRVKIRKVTKLTHTNVITSSSDQRLIKDLPVTGGKLAIELDDSDSNNILPASNDTNVKLESGTVASKQLDNKVVPSVACKSFKIDGMLTSHDIAGPTVLTPEDDIVPELVDRAESHRPYTSPQMDDSFSDVNKKDLGIEPEKQEEVDEADIIPGDSHQAESTPNKLRTNEDDDEIIPVIVERAEARHPCAFDETDIERDISEINSRQLDVDFEQVPVDELDVVPGEDNLSKDAPPSEIDECIPDNLNEQVMFLPPEIVDQEGVQSPSDFDEIEETLADGTVVKRKLLKTKVKKIITKKIRRVGPDGDIIEDIITEEVPESEFSDTSSLRSSLSGSCCDFASSVPSISSPAEPDYHDEDSSTVRVYTDTIEGDPQVETDVQEFEETLPDGTIIKRKVIKTRQKQTIVKRVVMEGPELDLPTTEEQAQLMLNQGNVFEPEVNYYTDKSQSEPEQSTNVEEYEDIQPDGTKVTRKIVRTTEQQLTTERTMKEGLGSQIPSLMGVNLNGKSNLWVEVPEESIMPEDASQAQGAIPAQNGGHNVLRSPEPGI